MVDRTPEEAAVLALARTHRLTVYDASYLELAQREALPLATLDQPLRPGRRYQLGRRAVTTALTVALAPNLIPAPLFAPTPRAVQRVVEFFTAQINNDHTRRPYLNATRRFGQWCAGHGLAQHFTPATLARSLVESALDSLNPPVGHRDSLTLCDPACGSGAFLQEALRALPGWALLEPITNRGQLRWRRAMISRMTDQRPTR